MHITINWSTVEEIIEENPSVENTIEATTSKEIIEELVLKVPAFRRAWFEDGMAVEEFEEYGPVKFFRDQFVKGWDFLTGTMAERRRSFEVMHHHS